jgi:hypothetical protein
MRWSNLTITADEQAQLPGYRDDAVVRRFDAPEALQTRFYEVRAKSALNRVPEASQVPFRWTINPYRGCSHACLYCVYGPTPILLADGRTRRMEDLRPGDRIMGTRRDGRYRRYVETEVLDHWTTVKPAYAVVLEDGTRIITSGDHRYLTERGWKHVCNSPRSEPDRPHLTINDALLGTGGFADTPRQCDDYKRGYLCGIIRGDGHVGSYAYRGGGRHTFRLALVDFEALRRTREFLRTLQGVETTERVFSAAVGNYRECRAVGTGRRADVERIRGIIEWPLRPNKQWRKGFLAGIFDAEGSSGGAEVLRIANCDQQIIHMTRESLSEFGFDATVERPDRENGLRVVRIRGGLRERIRFWHLTEPAITRKRSIAGIALKSDAKTRVV